MKGFNLSEKAIGIGELNDHFDFDNHVYRESDVKEFIKKLIESTNEAVGKLIDKLAGDKLSK